MGMVAQLCKNTKITEFYTLSECTLTEQSCLQIAKSRKNEF